LLPTRFPLHSKPTASTSCAIRTSNRFLSALSRSRKSPKPKRRSSRLEPSHGPVLPPPGWHRRPNCEHRLHRARAPG
jgi:hypothetical protein